VLEGPRDFEHVGFFVGAAAATLSATNVQVVKRIGIEGGLVTTIVNGDAGSMRTAVDTGARVAGQAGEPMSSHVIPNPAKGVIERLLA
jgi:ethanolamine utilization protein EutM